MLKAQTVIIEGQVIADGDVENINVMNITAKINTITDARGKFRIQVRLNDTLVFSSLLYKSRKVFVNQSMFSKKVMNVYLSDAITELDEVVLGKVLSGKLGQDIQEVEGKEPINFYDVGIPGYTGKLATQSERRLSEASSLKASGSSNGYGVGAAMQFTPLINAISGRTKMLKARVLHEAKDDLIHRIKTSIAQEFFKFYPLQKDLQIDFLYFCEADPTFLARCDQKTEFEIFVFLKEKLEQYRKNLSEKSD